LTPHHDKASAFMHVYGIYTNETLTYNKNDLIDYLWVSIKDLIQDGRKAKSDLPILINILEQYL